MKSVASFVLILVIALTVASIPWFITAQPEKTLVFDWKQPVNRVDGSMLLSSEIAGYELIGGGLFAEISRDSETYTASNYIIPSDGACFSLVTIDTLGNRSDPATACISAIPSAPSSFTIKIQ